MNITISTFKNNQQFPNKSKINRPGLSLTIASKKIKKFENPSALHTELSEENISFPREIKFLEKCFENESKKRSVTETDMPKKYKKGIAKELILDIETLSIPTEFTLSKQGSMVKLGNFSHWNIDSPVNQLY